MDPDTRPRERTGGRCGVEEDTVRKALFNAYLTWLLVFGAPAPLLRAPRIAAP